MAYGWLVGNGLVAVFLRWEDVNLPTLKCFDQERMGSYHLFLQTGIDWLVVDCRQLFDLLPIDKPIC